MDLMGLQKLKQLLLDAINKIEVQQWDLTKKQERFCILYATDREFFGNGIQAYVEAYNIDLKKQGAYSSAQTCASRLLLNVMVLNRINELLEADVLNDANVDKQLGFWLTQKAYPQAAMSAIKEYNALKQRITKKLDVTSGGKMIPILGGASVSLDNSTSEDPKPS